MMLMHSYRVSARGGRRLLSSEVARTAISNDISQVVKDHKKVLGPRAIIVSSLEEPHKAAAGKIWFHLQKAGIQSTFLNLKSKYPSVESIKDGINLLKRTGASSIVSIGNGTITDYGKALQFAIDSPASLNSLFTDPTSIPALKALPRISHVIIPTTPTPNHYVSSCQVIHPEEDILLEIPAFAPSVVCPDLEFAPLGGIVNNPSLAKAVLVSTLLDEVVAYHMHAGHVLGDEASRTQIAGLLQLVSLRGKFDTAMGPEGNQRSFAELLEVVADIRRQLRHLAGEMNTIPEAWGSPLQLIAMLMQTNMSLNLSLPFSYHFVTAAGSLLHHHAPAQRRRFVSAVDKKLLASVDFALTTLASSEGLGLSTEQLRQTIAEAMANIEATVNQQPKLFVAAKLPQRNGSTTTNNNNNSTVEALTAAGNLEKVSVFLDYLSEKHENAAVRFGEKKNLLRSDMVLDILEAMIETDAQQ